MDPKVCVERINLYKDKYVIFYSEFCRYSMDAVKLLQKKKVPFKGYLLEKVTGNLSGLLEHLGSLKMIDENHKTRPVIFKHSKFLGGFSELEKDLG